MDPSALEAIAVDPRLRGIAYRVAGSLIDSHPVLSVEDVAQDMALRLLERARRGSGTQAPALRLMVMDSIRRALGRSDRAGRNVRAFVPLDAVRDRHGRPAELAALPTDDGPDPDEETAEQVSEWLSLSVRERKERALASRRALLCSI